MEKVTFLIELAGNRVDIAILDKKHFDLTFSLFDAEVIILFGGLYCCENDPGYILLKELTRQHPNKTFYIVKGNGLHENFKQKANIIYLADINDL